MLRILFCISCCSPPPSARTKRRVSSNQQLKNSKQDIRERKVSQDSKNANEKDRSLANQIDSSNGNTTKANESQGKLTLTKNEKSADFDTQMMREGDSITASTSIQLQRANAIDYSDLNANDIEQLNELGAEFRSYDDGSVSPPSSIDMGPFTERNASANYAIETDPRQQPVDTEAPESLSQQDEMLGVYNTTDGGSTPRRIHDRYEPLASASKNIPSTTKIGDYARIEYSPIEDLDSLTTMSYSRLGSEKGGSRSQAGSTLSRQNSTKASFNDGNNSRRSSHGGIESTSISIASQLSNEQFQQNLTNMLESVNSNYLNLGTIGLPLGPQLEGTMTETTKTSPETPGAALTSASQDSLSDVAFDEMSSPSSRPGTLRSNVSFGAALVGGESVDRGNGPEDMADLAQPAPLASGEDEEGQQSYPSVSSQRLGGERVDTPQSIATTTSGGVTNPTPTPSEMSAGSGKKKRLKAKSLFKKLKPGNKKNKNDDVN